jgi:Predicted transcriptional regulator
MFSEAQMLGLSRQMVKKVEIITAIGNVAKAIGMTKIAEETGMRRPSLYKHCPKEQNLNFQL